MTRTSNSDKKDDKCNVALAAVRAMMPAGTRESGGIDCYHLQLFHLLLPLRFRFEASLLRGIPRRTLGLWSKHEPSFRDHVSAAACQKIERRCGSCLDKVTTRYRAINETVTPTARQNHTSVHKKEKSILTYPSGDRTPLKRCSKNDLLRTYTCPPARSLYVQEKGPHQTISSGGML